MKVAIPYVLVPPSTPLSKRLWRFAGGVLLWTPLVYLILLLIWNILPYFSFSSDLPFLQEKAVAMRDPIWRVSFYLHLASGIVVLLAPLLQFSGFVLDRAPAIHRRLGRVYVWTVLWLVVPTGLYLSFYAKGGWWGVTGFALTGVLMFYATWLGNRAIKTGNRFAHVSWMVRSFMLAMTAITFRILHILLYLAGFQEIYVQALWFSLLINLLLGEWVVFRCRKKRKVS